MKIKKRYLVLALSMALFATCRMDFLKFRTSDEAMLRQLVAVGQHDVDFFTYEVDGRKMHGVQIGNDSLPLVVMVHGAPGSSGNMLSYLADRGLTERAKVVAVDRPGYGHSDFGRPERSLERQAAALRPVLEQYRGSGPVILVGHSFGGPVISRMAMDFQELVDGLVIVAGSIDPELEPRHWYQGPLDWLAVNWMLPPAVRVCNQEILPLPGELEKMLPLWQRIACPVTVVQGMKDELVAPGNADFAEKMLVNSKRINIDTIEGKGHFIFWQEPGVIVGNILEMLDFLTVDTSLNNR